MVHRCSDNRGSTVANWCIRSYLYTYYSYLFTPDTTCMYVHVRRYLVYSSKQKGHAVNNVKCSTYIYS